MKVFLLKDVAKVGIAGEMVKVSDGFAANYLFPKKLAEQVTPHNESSFAKRVKVIQDRKTAIATETSMLAEKIRSLKLILKRKVHDDGKLYGSVSPMEVMELLADEGVKVAKNQVIFDKNIKEKGVHHITIKLSSRLQPTVLLKIVPEQD
ncbi:50S ribosomal protein L9 [Candidatus Babeliales bacterium]|nr:50S ribosomal protein L9 [Candidatus Babeliales bacterium]